MPSNRKGSPIYYFAEFKSWRDNAGGRVLQFMVSGLPTLRLRWQWNPPWVRQGYARHTNLFRIAKIKKGLRFYFSPWKLDMGLELQGKQRRRDDFYDRHTQVRGYYRQDTGVVEINKGQYYLEGKEIKIEFTNGDKLPDGTSVLLTMPR